MIARLNPLSLALALSAGLAAAPAQAVLVPAAGPGTGQVLIVHGNYGNLGASGALAPAVYNVDGQMLTAGLGYPVLGGLNASRFLNTPIVANVPVFLNTVAGQVPAINSARTTMVGVGGFGRAGLIAPTYTLNTGFVPGTIAANTFGGSVDYINAGGALFGANIGHFISGNLRVGGVGDFFAVGVRSKIEIGIGVGLGFIPTFTFFPTPIVIGYDGAGALPDFVAGGNTLLVPTGANTAFAAASSFGVFNVAAGATVRITGTVTLMGDPASFDFAPLPLDLLGEFPVDNLYGTGAASNAGDILPTPSAAALLSLGGLLAVRRRRV